MKFTRREFEITQEGGLASKFIKRSKLKLAIERVHIARHSPFKRRQVVT